MKNPFENIKFLWTETSIIAKIAVVCAIFAVVLAMVAGSHTDERRTTRTSFCLERGYDGFKISDGKYYCWNTVNGEIKKFRDPIQ